MSPSHSPKRRSSKPSDIVTGSWGPMAVPGKTLASLLTLQSAEDSKPKLSKISWLPDVLVYDSSIIPVVIGPVLFITLFSAGVALASIVWEKEVALTNNVVPLLSVVVGLLLVFRNSTAYERYAEGRKDFTSLISNARNLSRAIWINVIPTPTADGPPPIDRAELTECKRQLIRLVVGFVFATKHYLRAEGGVHHSDLRGLLPAKLVDFVLLGTASSSDDSKLFEAPVDSPREVVASPTASSARDEESLVGIGVRHTSSPAQESGGRRQPTRRPTAVRVIAAEGQIRASGGHQIQSPETTTATTERTPLIKSGVRTDVRKTIEDVAEARLGRMVEVGLPLIIAHEISRTLFRFRRQGHLEAIGPAGLNTMQGLVQSMIDQLGSMERIQTPLPYVFCVHLKQCVTMYLLCLPFVLVEVLGWKMIWIVTCTAFTLCGVEGIAAQIEQPFGTDPSDLNLDLFCTELLCECEAIIERLPEGDGDEDLVYERSPVQVVMDDEDGDD